jgi:pimeloyl-ACP methyl ester carboxylesterase
MLTGPKVSSGYFHNGLPFNRFGHGPRNLVVFQGLMFENKPLSGLTAFVMSRMYRFLASEFNVYIVTRRPGVPDGYTLTDMSDDYAEMIEQEFGGPVDVIGTSTGGSIAQHFAADHPTLVRRLVLHSSAYVLNEAARASQMRMGRLAQQHDWMAVSAESIRLVVPQDRWFTGIAIWLGSLVLSLTAPKDPSDLIATVEAEDKHDFKDRLREITAPTLVAAGADDPFYSEALFRETAEHIPHARLILYPGMGHPASGKQFGRDVLAFLDEEMPTASHARADDVATRM